MMAQSGPAMQLRLMSATHVIELRPRPVDPELCQKSLTVMLHPSLGGKKKEEARNLMVLLMS
jgi:hypothetical protein